MEDDERTKPEKEPDDTPPNQGKPVNILPPREDWDDYQTEEAPPPERKEKGGK
jgi:hypothetical protein